MGFRDSIRGGGGFLNNVDGEITGYEFTTVPPQGKDESDWVYLVPSIKLDGADDEITQHLFFGGADRYEISDDGQTLSSTDGIVIGAKTPAGRLLLSMLDNGLDESELPDLSEGEDLELSALVGKRYRFAQEIDEEANKKLGKRKVKDKKTGKMVEYNRTNTVVAKVYGTAESKPNGKGKPAAAVKANGKGKAVEVDLTDEADDVVRDLLSTNDGEIDRGTLSLKVTKALMKNSNREVLKKLILSEDYITDDAREGVFTLEGKGSKQKLVAA